MAAAPGGWKKKERHVAGDETLHQFFQLAQERALRSVRVSENCVGEGKKPVILPQ
jgi:hypothetical protein